MEDSRSNDFTYVLLPLSLQKYVCTVLIPDKGRGDQSSAKKVWLIVCKVWSCIRVTGHCNSNNSIAKKEQKEHLTCMGILNIHQNSKKIDHSQRDPLQTPPAIHKVSVCGLVCTQLVTTEDLNGFIRFSRSQRGLNSSTALHPSCLIQHR